MTKRPDLIEFVMQNGLTFLETSDLSSDFDGQQACVGKSQIFDQAVDFEDPYEECLICKTGSQHARHVSNVVATAKGICSACPMVEACLAWALSTDTQGVLGGLTSRERAELVNVPVLTAQVKVHLTEEYNFVKNAPVKAVCRRYGAVPRTVARWRSFLASQSGMA